MAENSKKRKVFGETVDVKTVIWVVSTLAAVLATYFATTSGLASRISTAEQYIQSQSPIDLVLKRSRVYEQINALTLVQLDIESLKKQVGVISFEFEYGEYEELPGVNPPSLPPNWSRYKVVVGTNGSGVPSTTLVANQLFSLAAVSSPLTSLSDPNLVSDIYRLTVLVNDYNTSSFAAGLFYPYAQLSLLPGSASSVGIGASQRSVEAWTPRAEALLTRLRDALDGSLYGRIEAKKNELAGVLSVR